MSRVLKLNKRHDLTGNILSVKEIIEINTYAQTSNLEGHFERVTHARPSIVLYCQYKVLLPCAPV